GGHNRRCPRAACTPAYACRAAARRCAPPAAPGPCPERRSHTSRAGSRPLLPCKSSCAELRKGADFTQKNGAARESCAESTKGGGWRRQTAFRLHYAAHQCCDAILAIPSWRKLN